MLGVALGLPAPAVVRYKGRVSRLWKALCVFGLLGVPGACVGDRTFPEPVEMCEHLVQVCGDPLLWDIDGLRQCHEIGRAGVRDSRQADQCFAVYDECLNECDYYGYSSNHPREAGADAAGVEAGASQEPAGTDAAALEPADSGAFRADSGTLQPRDASR